MIDPNKKFIINDNKRLYFLKNIITNEPSSMNQIEGFSVRIALKQDFSSIISMLELKIHSKNYKIYGTTCKNKWPRKTPKTTPH